MTQAVFIYTAKDYAAAKFFTPLHSVGVLIKMSCNNSTTHTAVAG